MMQAKAQLTKKKRKTLILKMTLQNNVIAVLHNFSLDKLIFM